MVVKHLINMSCLSIVTTFTTLLVAFTSANVGSHSTVKDPPQDQVDINLSPTVNNLLTGFDCKNPTNVESLELESVEKCEDRVQKSITKEGYIQILQQSDEYTLSASICKLRRTKKVSVCGAADHDTSLYDKSFTYRKTRVDVDECKMIHKDRRIRKRIKKSDGWDHSETPIALNTNTYIGMYIKGKQYASTQWDGNQLKCLGEITRIDNIDVSNGIAYEEDEWLIQETTLLTDGENMKDVNNNRILNCKPESEECYFNEESYFWSNKRPKCKFYELKKVRGTFTFIDGTRYFTANDSLIHLKVDKEPITSCGQKIFGTDFDKIYILNLDYQEPIKNNIKAESLSLMRDYATRDAWVFNRMTQMLHDNILTLTRKHCHDTALSHTNWLRIVTSYKLDAMTPFSLSPESDKFLMPVGENLIVYKCTKKLLKPKNLNNGKCYKHLPVTTLNREFIPQSNTNTTMFLTPHSRIISNVGVEIPCSDVFITKFKTYTGNWVSYTKNGVEETLPPKKFAWSKDVDINMDTGKDISFGIDKGLYNFDTIEEFDEMQIFTGETQSILSTIVRNIAKVDENGKKHRVTDGRIEVERVFPSFPWTKLKDSVINGFAFFGQICSIIIGLWTIFTLVRNIVNGCVNCFLIRQIGETIQATILYLINPSAFFIKNLPKKNPGNQTEESEPLAKQMNPSKVLTELRLLNENLPSYKA